MNQLPSDDKRLAPVSFLPWVQKDGAVQDDGAVQGDGAVQDDVAVQGDGGRPAGAAPALTAVPAPVPAIADAVAEPESEADLVEHDRVDRIVLNSLRRRGLSEWEVCELLRANDVPSDAWHGWIDRYRVLGYLNDAQLAEELVRTHHGRKGLGRQAVARELKARHIDNDLIDTALAEIDADEEQERATELALKRAGQLSSYDNATATRRLTGFLMRKGYSSDVVRHAIDTAMADRIGRRGTTSTVQFR